MVRLKKIHHVAIICCDYEKSKEFYVNILGLKILQEIYRRERASFKLDLGLNNEYIIELFSFPGTPPRLSRPEAAGLRHLAFEVKNLDEILKELKSKNVKCEEIRKDEFSGKRFAFIFDPDNLPVELYEE